MAKPNDPKIGTIRAAQVISLVRKSRLTTLLLAAAAARSASAFLHERRGERAH